jgi:adenosine deaminase
MIRRITREAIADAAADNVRYMELRFTPVALTRIKNFPIEEAMDWVLESSQRAAKEFGVQTRLIASVNRHESTELAAEVAGLAVDRMDHGIIGLDLAGDEANFSGSPFADIFTEAKQAGLKITIHAGEWGKPGNIIEAIEILGTERIGHGVRVLEDPQAIELALEHNTPFEVCITSNYHSGVTTALDQHPILKMIDAGLNVTINTDDPSLSQIDLSDEYETACENLGMDIEVLRECIINAGRASFLPSYERRDLIHLLEEESAEIN